MATMRAIDIKDGKGPVESLYINKKKPKPEVKPQHALVKVKAFGLNRVDLVQREGKYPVPPQAPDTLGIDFSGTIEAVDEYNPEGFKPGDAVFGLSYGGAYAEYVVVPTGMLIRKPSALSWEESAGIPATYLTAIQVMYLIADFTAGKTILWHGGSSAVAIAGQQLSVANGAAQVFATARSDEKCTFCVERLGATAAFNSVTSKWDEEVLRATEGKGVDIIVDIVGPATFAGNLNAAARDGRIVNLSILSGAELTAKMEQPDFGLFMRKRLRYEGNGLRSRDEEYQRRLRDQLAERAMPLFEDGRLKVQIDQILPWTEIQKAHRLLEENKTKGKVICTID